MTKIGSLQNLVEEGKYLEKKKVFIQEMFSVCLSQCSSKQLVSSAWQKISKVSIKKSSLNTTLDSVTISWIHDLFDGLGTRKHGNKNHQQEEKDLYSSFCQTIADKICLSLSKHYSHNHPHIFKFPTYIMFLNFQRETMAGDPYSLCSSSFAYSWNESLRLCQYFDATLPIFRSRTEHHVLISMIKKFIFLELTTGAMYIALNKQVIKNHLYLASRSCY